VPIAITAYIQTGAICWVAGMLITGGAVGSGYGAGAISSEVGGVLGWAFECYEKGLLTRGDTGSVKLKWESGEALINLISFFKARLYLFFSAGASI